MQKVKVEHAFGLLSSAEPVITNTGDYWWLLVTESMYTVQFTSMYLDSHWLPSVLLCHILRVSVSGFEIFPSIACQNRIVIYCDIDSVLRCVLNTYWVVSKNI